MARPIIAPPVLTGKAAENLLRHLETAKPNPVNDERNRQARKIARQIKRMD